MWIKWFLFLFLLKKRNQKSSPLQRRPSTPVTKFVTHLTDSFSPYPHHLKPYVATAMLSHPRIGILGSLIKGLPDLWPRLNDETAFGHFFDRTKNNLVIHITNLMPGALTRAQASAQKMLTHLEDGASSSFTECGFTTFNPLTGTSFSHTPL